MWCQSHFLGSPTMSVFSPILPIWVFSILIFLVFCNSASLCPDQFLLQVDRKFEQKTDRFWEFEEQSNSWVEVELPYDLISCVNENCTKVGSIGPYDQTSKKGKDQVEREIEEREEGITKKKDDLVLLPIRKRVSLVKMSENSVWVIGASGSIYERFWNGVQWVIAPHDLPVFAGPAISVFIVNQTIFALSEAGNLYQMELNENSHPVWVDFTPKDSQSTNKDEAEQNSSIQLISGVISDDGQRVYFCTKDGSLLELSDIEPPRWVTHGRPPGANVAAIADAGTFRPEVIFTISSNGGLYEYDRNSKPSWKKHIWIEGTAENTSLIPSTGCPLHGLGGAQSVSLFLLTKGGNLVERRLHQRKWKWIVHGSPEYHFLSSITPVSQDESNEKTSSLFLSTASGTVFEYRVSKYAVSVQYNQLQENWVSHMHPPHVKVARGISGQQFQVGRIIFPLDDGRLAELHAPGFGGETAGPTHLVNGRRKASFKYIWSILDAPESEGWNAEYCTEERGPSNCLVGIKNEPNDAEIARSRARKGSKAQQNYLSPDATGSNPTVALEDKNSMLDSWINTNFRLRVMHGGRSFFLITDSGFTFEYLNAENVWIWLRHEHSTAMRGAVGHYNGSLFLVDEQGSLLIRERTNSELAWINCTSMRKGRQIIGGPPWDKVAGKGLKVTPEDAMFFVAKTGRLLQFTVALRKFKWKDCRNPQNTKIAGIVDQEGFRENIVFVIGRNGRLYQYNKVTEIWHEHRQSQHLVLSRLPGTAMRQTQLSLTGSLFMLSEDGGLVEYLWNSLDGWNWVEHGSPHHSVALVGSPGPCFMGNQLFLIGSDGNVYLRYLDQTTWKWKNCGFPYMGQIQVGEELGNEGMCTDDDFAAGMEKNEERINDLNRNCDSKVAPIRPIPFTESSVIFELKDGRLAEMQQREKTDWVWSRVIGTPTSLCIAQFWTGLAS